jgi:hypothetical protein
MTRTKTQRTSLLALVIQLRSTAAVSAALGFSAPAPAAGAAGATAAGGAGGAATATAGTAALASAPVVAAAAAAELDPFFRELFFLPKSMLPPSSSDMVA